MVNSSELRGRLRLVLIPARGTRTWFDSQLAAIRGTGASYDDTAQVWVRWVDPADHERMARVITDMATVARDYGATLTVTPGAAVLDG